MYQLVVCQPIDIKHPFPKRPVDIDAIIDVWAREHRATKDIGGMYEKTKQQLFKTQRSCTSSSGSSVDKEVAEMDVDSIQPVDASVIGTQPFTGLDVKDDEFRKEAPPLERHRLDATATHTATEELCSPMALFVAHTEEGSPLIQDPVGRSSNEHVV